MVEPAQRRVRAFEGAAQKTFELVARNRVRMIFVLNVIVDLVLIPLGQLIPVYRASK